ncbi:hypothetical protein [Staphylococcus haemolyticus]|uniref:hypothetical protein n=1 Tax=Staphylococcus haemolyticus TaxID=1283 RepID=UPI001F0AEDCD|nr:hypothetical protein [Staphylococcus haemolyticus]MCH4334945.1 hypothetical protein [Staphylococcus haemolyticus]
MKKSIYLVSLVCLFAIVLTACSKDTKDSMQGAWKSENIETTNHIGEKIEIKDDKIEVKDNNLTEHDKVKYFTLSGKEKKNIKLYNETPSDEDFDKELSKYEGTISFNDNKMIIKTETYGNFILSKE